MGSLNHVKCAPGPVSTTILPPLVDPGPITCNRAPRAAALLLCNRTQRGGRPSPNGTLLVPTPTYSNVVGHIWIYSIFQLPQPVATTDTPPKKKMPRTHNCLMHLHKHHHRPQRPSKLTTAPSPPLSTASLRVSPPLPSPTPNYRHYHHHYHRHPPAQCHGPTPNHFPPQHPGQAIQQHLKGATAAGTWMRS